MRARRRATWVMAAVAAATTACEIDYGIGSAPEQPLDVSDAPVNKPLDILFVLDNSGSMAEEQAALARTIYKPECPISDLTQVPEALLDPEPGVLEDLARVCGFSQILAAYDRDFRVGVITTDVDACDNFLPDLQGKDAHGFHPQRGCLQPVPSTGQRFIERKDIDVAGKFNELIGNIGTFGSPYERGFDAADIFLNRDTWVAEGCEDDRDDFIRDDAQLLVIFVSDEDDCSHLGTSFREEALTTCGDLDTGALVDFIGSPGPGACYDPAADLVDVDAFAQRLGTWKGITRTGDVSVAVIGGAIDEVNGLIAAGCLSDGGGVALGTCRPSEGNSNATGPGQPCDPALGGDACCTADAASRYLRLDDDLTVTAGSICSANYIDTLITATQATENDG